MNRKGCCNIIKYGFRPMQSKPSTMYQGKYTIARLYTICDNVILLCAFDMSVLGLLTNLLPLG